jgi:hypothetical protein
MYIIIGEGSSGVKIEVLQETGANRGTIDSSIHRLFYDGVSVCTIQHQMIG